MANLTIPQELLDRLRADTPWRGPMPTEMTCDERELLALQLEWLAAEVRENRVREATWSWDREPDEDPYGPLDPCPVSAFDPVRLGPKRYTVEVQF